MTGTMYGYIRVSTKDQNEARQLAAMKQFGVAEDHMVVEKQSGKDFQRPRYQKLLQRLRPGDVLVVKSIDRLGRNYTEILDQWSYLTKTRNVAIVVLDMPLLDTRQGRDLTGTLISDIVLQLLSYVAETERQNIRQRQTEGIEAAMKRGIRFGRRPRALTAWPPPGSRGRSPPGPLRKNWASPIRPSCAGRKSTASVPLHRQACKHQRESPFSRGFPLFRVHILSHVSQCSAKKRSFRPHE